MDRGNGSPGPEFGDTQIKLRMPFLLEVAIRGFMRDQKRTTLVPKSLSATVCHLIETNPEFLHFMEKSGYTIETQARP